MSFPGFPDFISFGTPKISFIGTFFRPTSSSVSASSEYPPVVFRAASHSRAMCIVSPPKPWTLTPWLPRTWRSKP